MPEVSTISAKQQDLKCYGGDTWALILKFWSDTAKTIPIDISSYVFALEIKNKATDATPLLRLTEGNGLTFIASADNNELDIEKKILLKGKAYVYDLQITYTDLTIQTYMYGAFTVMQDVTENTNEK